MGKTVFIAPHTEIVEQVNSVLHEFPGLVDEVIHVKPPISASKLAQQHIAAGADIIIARGLQAMSIEKRCDVPIIALRMTAQEVALLVNKAKRLCTSPHPRIALLGTENMFPDLSAFNELFDIELLIHNCDPEKELGSAGKWALEQEVDAIIGGQVDIKVGERSGIPSLYTAVTVESIREALKVAAFLRESINRSKLADAQNDALFNGTFNGFIQFDVNGNPLRCNKAAEMLLGLSEKKILKSHITALFPNINVEKFSDCLKTGTAMSDFVRVDKQSFAIIVKPVLSGDSPEGAILSLRKTGKDLNSWSSSQFHSRTNFIVKTNSPKMKEMIRLAKRFCHSSHALLIHAEAGTDILRLVRPIHANTDCSKNGQLICADAACWDTSELQSEYLFGYGPRASGDDAYGLIGLARDGTLWLDRIDCLTKSVQHRLWQVLDSNRYIYHYATTPVNISFRLVASTTLPPEELQKSGRLIPELYAMLAPLSFSIPPLRETAVDLPDIINNAFARHCSDNNRFLTLSQEAVSQLCTYPWYGNSTQLYFVLERLVLLAETQTITRSAVKALVESIYPPENPATEAETPPDYSPDELKIIRALRQNAGDRDKTAQDLGISKTTLWRRMKKYDITTKY